MSWGCPSGTAANAGRLSLALESSMVRVFLRHEGVDYPNWRRQYDSFVAERRAMGVVNDNVFRNVEDDHEVTVSHDFETLAAAERFVSPRRLHEAKTPNGASTEPSVWFAEL